MIGVYVQDGKGTRNKVKVTDRGQLVVAPLEYSIFYEATAILINTAYNIVSPQFKKRFVITTIDIYANKDVGVGDAAVEIYEATSEDSLVVTKCIYAREMLKQSSTTLTGLNIIVDEGRWINVKTDDNTVFVNMAGYYVDA